MELFDCKYLVIALVIGIVIGWYLFSSGQKSTFVGLSPILEQFTGISKVLNYTREYEEEEIPRKSVPRTNFQSKGEEECGRAAKEVFGTEFKKVRPAWLINPKTGRRLEIDWYSEKLKIGIEYNGKQHYVFPNSIHQTKEEFDDQRERDRVKINLCDEHGVYLITVPYTVPLNKIKDYIEYYHPDRRSERLLNGETGSSID